MSWLWNPFASAKQAKQMSAKEKNNCKLEFSSRLKSFPNERGLVPNVRQDTKSIGHIGHLGLNESHLPRIAYWLWVNNGYPKNPIGNRRKNKTCGPLGWHLFDPLPYDKNMAGIFLARPLTGYWLHRSSKPANHLAAPTNEKWTSCLRPLRGSRCVAYDCKPSTGELWITWITCLMDGVKGLHS